MYDSETFAKKIKELSLDEVEYSADFFKAAIGDAPTSITTIKKNASQGAKRNITETFDDADIDEEWLNQSTDSFEGQLAVDVFQTDNEIVITSTVAGLNAEDLDIDMNGDMITIKGVRKPRFDHVQGDDYFIKECYWGGFSRSIILPVDIIHDQINAKLENGILTITLPKSQRSNNGKITVEDISA